MGVAVVDDPAVLETDDALGLDGDGVVVGDEDHGVPLGVEFLEEGQHLPAGTGVQSAGGLVGQDHGGVAGQGPGDGHTLLLTAGELAGQVLALFGQPNPLQGADGPLMPLLGAHTGVEKGQLHILLDVELGNQIVLLEDEAQHLIADLGLLVVVHGGYVHASQVVGAGGGDVQTADDVHGGGFAGAGGAHDGDKFSAVHGEAHAVQGVDALIAHLVDLVDVLEFNEVFHLITPSSWP